MTTLFAILCAVIIIGVLVVIHEGGHFFAAKAFGVRVTELMVGLPGPDISFSRGETRFGLTAVPLGGYAKVCGMETGDISPHLRRVLVAIYEAGSASAAAVANSLSISPDDAEDALEELVEWGSIDVRRGRRGAEDIFLTPRCVPTQKGIVEKSDTGPSQLPEPASASDQVVPAEVPQPSAKKHKRRARAGDKTGQPYIVTDAEALYDSEYARTFRSLPLWKKSIILLAGIAMNLIFTILAFVLIYSIIGVDMTDAQTGDLTHVTVSPLRSIYAGFSMIAMTFQAILGLFNPATAAETVSNSASIVGIAYLATDYFAAGFSEALFFMALVSVSLGLMNLLPIPPLDGGRFVVEVIQRIVGKNISMRALSVISVAGMVVFICFFLFMLNQDIQRFILGIW